MSDVTETDGVEDGAEKTPTGKIENPENTEIQKSENPKTRDSENTGESETPYTHGAGEESDADDATEEVDKTPVYYSVECYNKRTQVRSIVSDRPLSQGEASSHIQSSLQYGHIEYEIVPYVESDFGKKA